MLESSCKAVQQTNLVTRIIESNANAYEITNV